MDYLEIAIQAAYLAGKKILNVYTQDFAVISKSDNSPLTEADIQSNEIILQTLKQTGIPVISEEIKSMDFEQRSTWDLCWIVDPLDGTKEFVKRNGEFTVNIALVSNGLPVLGVVYLPVLRRLYFTSDKIGSHVINLHENELLPDMISLQKRAKHLTHQTFPDIYTIVASRSHSSPATEAFVDKCKSKYKEIALVSHGSSLKLCMVAEGKAHVYPRLGPTMEWDTAAAHAVAKFAGCKVLDFYTKKELRYNKENLLNPYFIVLRKEDDFESVNAG